MGSQDEFVENW